MYVKNRIDVHIDKNALIDEGDGVITFAGGLTITDDSEQWNGTRYDIATMDIEQYGKKVTADHIDSIQTLIGRVGNVFKQGNKVLVDSIRFAVKESAAGRLAYDLIKGGFLTDFSVETTGMPPDDDGTYRNASLVGLSAVVVGNNKNANVNQAVLNSIARSKQEGLDTEKLEKVFNEQEKPDSAEKTEETPLESPSKEPEKKPEVGDKTEESVKTEAKPIKKETEMSEVTTAPEEKKVEEVKTENAAPAFDMKELGSIIGNAVSTAVKPMQEKIEAMEQNAFDAKAKEPEFKKADNSASAPVSFATDTSELAAMSYQDRHGKQINAAWDLLKRHDSKAADVLNKINEVNLAGLKKEKLVRNALTIADFGNFVISPELMSEIQGCRNNYTSLVNATEWRETLSTQMAWLKRSGDIDMQSVEFCDDGANGNLKPLSEYTASIETANLEELAAVTPVCNAATRFLAADLLGDVASGYRNDYDRKRAQLVIARLEQAVEANGNSELYNAATAVDKLNNFVDVWTQIATCTPNGTFVFNTSTYGEIMKQAVTAGVNGPLGSIFLTGNVPTIFGRPFIVVPDDLMPRLGVSETRTFTVNGVTVTVNHAVFYADLSIFTGRTSGGLMYDLSTEAAYEDNGTVKSAYQRNELVLRGSFFRGGAIKDEDQVAGLLTAGVS